MKVKKLMEFLKACDPNAEVILQGDGEGNHYSPLSDASNEAVYTPETTWSGEVFWTSWSAEDACMDEDEHARMLKRKRCVVLQPVN